MDDEIGAFRERVARLRKERGISARALSLRIGQNSAYIQQLESELRNKKIPGVAIVEAIADVLEVSPDELLGRPPLVAEERASYDAETERLAELGRRVVRLVRDATRPPPEVVILEMDGGLREQLRDSLPPELFAKLEAAMRDAQAAFERMAAPSPDDASTGRRS